MTWRWPPRRYTARDRRILVRTAAGRGVAAKPPFADMSDRQPLRQCARAATPRIPADLNATLRLARLCLAADGGAPHDGGGVR